MPFNGLIPALQSQTIDAAISGMTITAEPGQTVNFTRPYFQSGLAIAIGTTGAQEAAKIPGVQLSTFDNSARLIYSTLNININLTILFSLPLEFMPYSTQMVMQITRRFTSVLCELFLDFNFLF